MFSWLTETSRINSEEIGIDVEPNAHWTPALSVLSQLMAPHGEPGKRCFYLLVYGKEGPYLRSERQLTTEPREYEAGPLALSPALSPSHLSLPPQMKDRLLETTQ